jgi:hypothetical protein
MPDSEKVLPETTSGNHGKALKELPHPVTHLLLKARIEVAPAFNRFTCLKS